MVLRLQGLSSPQLASLHSGVCEVTSSPFKDQKLSYLESSVSQKALLRYGQEEWKARGEESLSPYENLCPHSESLPQLNLHLSIRDQQAACFRGPEDSPDHIPSTACSFSSSPHSCDPPGPPASIFPVVPICQQVASPHRIKARLQACLF